LEEKRFEDLECEKQGDKETTQKVGKTSWREAQERKGASV